MHAKTSTSLLRVCVYAQIIQRWKTLFSKIIVDVLRPAQNLQVWKTYIPADSYNAT